METNRNMYQLRDYQRAVIREALEGFLIGVVIATENAVMRRWGQVNAKVAWHQDNACQKRYGVMLAYAQADWVDRPGILDARHSLFCARHCRNNPPIRKPADLIGQFLAIQIRPARDIGKSISVRV